MNDQKWLEVFESFIDGIYFAGYVQQIKENDPEKYSWELNEFLSLYSQRSPC